MPIFEYRAQDPEGKPFNGTLVSPSLTAAAAELEKRGYRVDHLAASVMVGDPIPADFKAGSEDEKKSPDITSQRHYVQTHVVGQFIGQVPLNDLAFFFRQLSTMLHAGVGMVQTFDTLGNQTHNGQLKSIIREISQHAREGRPMSAGMQRYPEVFSPLILSLVRVGEESGVLDATLAQISDYIEREIKLRNLIRRNTMYPKIVIGASIVIILVANMIIGSVGGKNFLTSPLTTPSTWIVLGPFLVGLWLFVKLGLPNPNVKEGWDRAILKIPYLGHTVYQMIMAKFGRALAALYRGGVPMPRAVMLAADACGSQSVRAQIYPAAKRLEEGGSITQTFAETGAFHPIVLDMVQTGESTGNLDMMLDKLADFYEGDSEVRANAMAMILGVVCLLIVGAYVCYLAVTFYGGQFAAIKQEM